MTSLGSWSPAPRECLLRVMSGPSLSLRGMAAYYPKAEIVASASKPNAAIAHLSTVLTGTRAQRWGGS